MATSADRTYEQQNDSALDALYSKVSSLRSVTVDIHNDSESQRAGLLSQTSDQFDQFGSQLQRTSNHFSRTIVNGARQHRLTLYIRLKYSTFATPLKSCPKCSEPQPLESLSCPKCSTLQPLPSDIDFYKAMNLDFTSIPQNGWSVDPAALKRAWRLKMAVTHPDRMVGRSDKEQQIGAQQSALINRAYETLLNPLPRAHYLLERHNAPEVSESDSLEDPELLMEVMELRERLEEAESEEEAAEVRADNAKLLEATVETLAQAFGQSPPDLETARQAAVQLRYWTNIEKAAREWSPGKRVELQH